MNNDCNKIMCDLDIYTKNDANKWLLKNHPDKSNDVDVDLFTNVSSCYKTRDFCKPDESLKESNNLTSNENSSIKKLDINNNLDKSKNIKRSKIFSCMRQTENWSKILPYHKLDNKGFNPSEVQNDIHESSPKLEQLFRIIKQVDENDMEMHGKYFKHFIFSDVKDQGYGAKIIASAFIANGYNNLLEARNIPNQKALRLSLLKTDENEKYNSFGMLSSTAIFNSTFNQKIKKEILQTYNKRPDNINGENMRFIILDSGFKEGIDLFDVKYVHIFEPSMTIADLKQTIGRATRTCGQKGLNFEPNVGWPLYVYNYYIAIPEILHNMYVASDLSLLKNPNEDKYILKNEKLKEAAMIYSQFDKTLTNLSEQLYKLAPIFSVDFILTKNIHRLHDATYMYDIGSNDSLIGGKRFATIDKINCNGHCGLRSTKDIPATVKFLYNVYLKYGHDKRMIPKKNAREYFCKYMIDHPEYCEQLNIEWTNRAAMVPELVYNKKSSKPISVSTNSTRKSTRKSSLKTPKSNLTSSLNRRLTQKISSKRSKSSARQPQTVSSLKIANEVMQELQLVPYIAPINEREYQIEEQTGNIDIKLRQKKPGPPSTRLNFSKMRDFIATNFTDNFIWDEIEIENKCIDKPRESKVGGASRIMKLNPTQDFVRTYFTPQSPYKGILLWQSVGTGKTCTAIATATSSFEQEGYTILWVTRNTLKSDVYKNMFDDVCHIILAERMQHDRLSIPEDQTQRKRLLSKNWIEPISYKTFSNLLTPGSHNEYLDKLIARNGTSDVLRKTLIIIDEAHKLYGGDLKAAERPDMEIMEKLLQNSYDKSGKDSARLLLMTATPFTNSPLELFKLINLCKEEPSEKITTDINKFKNTYMNKDNILSEAGSKKLADNLSGYISYLNREQDPTQFAQPIMIEVPAIMTHINDPNLREFLFKPKDKEADKEAARNVKQNLKEQLSVIKDLKKRLKETKKNIKEILKKRQSKCKTIKNKKEKNKCMQEAKEETDKEADELINEINEELINMQTSHNADKTTIKMDKQNILLMKEKIKMLKDSLLQEVMLYKRCKNIVFDQEQ
jgi:hypothetical protein